MNSAVRCDFCAFRCRLGDGQSGHCGVRRNISGTIQTLVSNQSVALAVDPIEKKPFYHIMPGSQTLSVALFGCNFSCQFCQNAAISQIEYFPTSRSKAVSPQEFAERRQALALPSVAFTYSEPTVWQDWMIAAATEVKKTGGRCFMISNGFFSSEARNRFQNLIDGINIDLKGNDGFYRKYCGAWQEPVMDNIRALCASPGPIVEICTMLIEGIHDFDQILAIGDQLAAAKVQVWHLSRFFPAHHMSNRSPTSEDFLHETLEKIRSRIDIPYIYPGNSQLAQNTFCPGCQKLLVARAGGRFGLQPHFTVNVRSDIEPPACPDCGHSLYFLL